MKRSIYEEKKYLSVVYVERNASKKKSLELYVTIAEN